MMKLILPIFLTGIAVAIVVIFANPIFTEIKELRAEVAFYDKALDNAKALEEERDKLVNKSNLMNPDDLLKLTKLLPSSIDNIRLILEIEQIALPFGMALKNVKYNSTPEAPKTATGPGATPAEVVSAPSTDIGQSSGKSYGTWDLEFSTTGSYNNFLNFSKALESNLRIVDVASVQFASGTTTPATGATGATGAATPSSTPTDSYTYNFKIRTYWLKN